MAGDDPRSNGMKRQEFGEELRLCIVIEIRESMYARKEARKETRRHGHKKKTVHKKKNLEDARSKDAINGNRKCCIFERTSVGLKCPNIARCLDSMNCGGINAADELDSRFILCRRSGRSVE